jgi:hypothetical protein
MGKNFSFLVNIGNDQDECNFSREILLFLNKKIGKKLENFVFLG